MLVGVGARPAAGHARPRPVRAPGGKTTHLAELMDNRGRVTACDIDAEALETVTGLCERLGVKGVETVVLKETRRSAAGAVRRGGWWTCRAATPACSAAGRRCAGGCGRTSSST